MYFDEEAAKWDTETRIKRAKIYNAKELVIESNKFSNTEHEDDKSIIVINFQ